MLRAAAIVLGSIVGLVLLALVYSAADAGRVYQRDIFQDYLAARALVNGVDPYLPQTELAARYAPRATTEFPHPTPHPPPSILLFVPFAATTYRATVTIWLGVEVLCLIGAVFLLSRAAKQARSIGASVVASAILIAWPPVFVELNTGQVMLLLLVLLAAARLAFVGRRSKLGGVLLGLAVAIKPVPWPLVLWLAYRREWRAFGSAVITVGASYSLAALVIGPGRVVAYLTSVMPEVAGIYRNLAGNFSLWTLGPRLFVGTDVSISGDVFALARAAPPLVAWPLAASVTSALLPALLLIGAIWLLRARNAVDLELGALVCLSLLISPTFWDSYLVLLALPVAAVIQRWTYPNASRSARFTMAVCLVVTAVPFFVTLPLVTSLREITFAWTRSDLLAFAVMLLTYIPTLAVGVIAYVVATLPLASGSEQVLVGAVEANVDEGRAGLV